MTESQIIGQAIEIDAARVMLPAEHGRIQTGRELAAALALLGNKVKFLRWPNGVGAPVAFAAWRTEPTRKQIIQAYRDAVEVQPMVVHAEASDA